MAAIPGASQLPRGRKTRALGHCLHVEARICQQFLGHLEAPVETTLCQAISQRSQTGSRR